MGGRHSPAGRSSVRSIALVGTGLGASSDDSKAYEARSVALMRAGLGDVAGVEGVEHGPDAGDRPSATRR